ncbi:MAG: autotransporter assembly complex protein TamA, partial [Candidatus Levyibacteriota bacterium]
MTDDLLAELIREAIAQAKEAAATEGYFAAKVDVGVDRSTSPTTVTLHVVPGAQAHVTAVNLRVSGAAEHDPQGEAAIATLRQEWLLPVGASFRQSVWEREKSRAVAMLAGSGYAAAKLTTSLAQIDPVASTAELGVDIDSGPLFHVGELDITGLSRYPPELLRNYRTLKRGDRYSITQLDQFVRRLNGTGYFASVQAAIDTDPAHASD